MYITYRMIETKENNARIKLIQKAVLQRIDEG